MQLKRKLFLKYRERKINKMEEEKTIEILFPEICNLFGDNSNMDYLKKCLPKATFLSKPVDLIYLGPMTERTQEKVIKKLKPYKEKIQELIEKDVIFLFTGNSLEVLGNYIENEDGSKIEGLGIFDIYSKRDMMNRHNSLFKGTFEDIEICRI